MPLLYYTAEDLNGFIDEKRLIELTNDEEADEVGMEILEKVNTSAVATIDSYFHEDYETPFNPVPKVIADLAQKLTIVMLWERRDAANVPESIVALRREVERDLTRLSEIGIQGATPKNEIAVSQSYTNKTAEDRVFTNDLLKTYRDFPL